MGRVLRQARRIFIQIFKIRGIFNKHMSKAAYRSTSNKDEKVAPSMLMFNLVHRDFGSKFLKTPKSWIRAKDIVHVH